MFDDVFFETPASLQKQKVQMREHMAKYPEEYPEGDRV
jgi:hypothetical protein